MLNCKRPFVNSFLEAASIAANQPGLACAKMGCVGLTVRPVESRTQDTYYFLRRTSNIVANWANLWQLWVNVWQSCWQPNPKFRIVLLRAFVCFAMLCKSNLNPEDTYYLFKAFFNVFKAFAKTYLTSKIRTIFVHARVGMNETCRVLECVHGMPWPTCPV